MIIPRTRLFWAIGLGHITVDTFTSMGPVLLAFLSTSILPMSNTQIGFAVSAMQLLNALSQPIFGLITDRSGGRMLGVVGVSWTVGMLMFSLVMAQTGQYWLLFIPFVLAALGSGAFHPVGTMYAAESSKDRVARNLSIFFLLGQTGLALGPALAGILLDQAEGYHRALQQVVGPVLPTMALQQGSITPIFAMALAAIPGVLFMALAIPGRRSYTAARQHESHLTFKDIVSAIPMKGFITLAALVTLRSLAQPGSVAFIPLLFQKKGWDPAEYGLITSSFWIASGLAGVFFGTLADRFDRRHVIAVSLFLSAPAFFLLPVVDGALAFGLAIAAGALSGASHSIIVALAQELIPARKGFASGATLGFIFGTGALGSLIIGGVSDLITLETTFQMVAVLIVAASVLGLMLPSRKPPAPMPIPDGSDRGDMERRTQQLADA